VTLLAVEDPRPVIAGPVPVADVEVAAIRHHFPTSEALRGPAATRAEVLARLARFDVLHFACHGIASPAEPLKSALVLASDEPLSLGDLLDVRLRRAHAGGARLAVLSACETSRPGAALPDEIVSLPSGMLEAGVAGVIASQWAVDGAAAAMLMSRFYERWRADGLEPAAALADAQIWLRDTTNSEKAAWFAEERAGGGRAAVRLLWQAAVRKDPTGRAYAQPHHWAAFAHFGA
jgi:CHAT domain-containing protein